MSRLLRAPGKSPRDVEAFLAETHPGADAHTRLHALICCLYHAPLFEGRGSRQTVAGKAAARGVTSAKLRQIVAGDLAGITWSALEAVLTACGAFQADIAVAQELFNQVQTADPHTIPPAKAAPRVDPLDDWAPVQPPRRPRSSRTEPTGPPPWAWPEENPRPDTPAEAVPSGPAPARTSVPTSDPAQDTAPDAESTGTGSTGSGDASAGSSVRCGPDVPGCIAAGGTTAGGADVECQDATEAATPAAQAPVSSAGTEKADHAEIEVDPWTAGDPGGFVALMRKFRLLKGERPYREMAKVCARHPAVPRPYAFASFCTIGKNGKLPRHDLVRAYIAGAGGTDAEIDQWLKAHARLAIRPGGASSADEA